jgi:hypothetical protein
VVLHFFHRLVTSFLKVVELKVLEVRFSISFRCRVERTI